MIQRIRLQAVRIGIPLAVVLVVIGLAAFGWAGYEYASTPDVEETEVPVTVDGQQIALEVSHNATVIQNTTLYDEGEQLEQMPVYFLNATPIVTVDATITGPDYNERTDTSWAGEDQEWNLSVELHRTHRGVRDEQEFWSEQTKIAETTKETKNSTESISAELNVTEIQEELLGFAEPLDPVTSPETVLQVEATYETTAPNESIEAYSGTLTAEPVLHVDESVYWFNGQFEDEIEESSTATRVEREPIKPDMGVISVLLLVGITSLIGSLAVRAWVREVDIDELERTVHHDQYDEWISTGDLPLDREGQYVFVSSIPDLVNVGIDTDKRVIYDPDLDAYAVADGSRVYYHAANPNEIAAWVSG